MVRLAPTKVATLLAGIDIDKDRMAQGGDELKLKKLSTILSYKKSKHPLTPKFFYKSNLRSPYDHHTNHVL